MTRHAARARLLGCITLLALACLVGATSAQADVPGPITTRVMAILNTAGSGTTGMYVKQVGGPVIAAQNENFAFAPASSIKVLLHLYMHDQVEANAANFTDQVTLYAGVNTSCPNGAAVLGTEDMDDLAAKMMRFSDNPATRAQYEHWAPFPGRSTRTRRPSGSRRRSSRTSSAATSASRGSTATRRASPTSGSSTRALTTARASQARSARTSTTRCRVAEQAVSFGGDFTGIWPVLTAMVDVEKPAGMPNELRDDFVAGMTANHKGGSYQSCSTVGCARTQFLSWPAPPCSRPASRTRSPRGATCGARSSTARSIRATTAPLPPPTRRSRTSARSRSASR